MHMQHMLFNRERRPVLVIVVTYSQGVSTYMVLYTAFLIFLFIDWLKERRDQT